MSAALEKLKRYRMLTIFIIIALLLVIFNIIATRKEPQGKKVGIQTLRDLSELATIEYNIKKIVKFKDDNWLGRRAILIETTAILKAGIDLSEITSQDIRQQGDEIVIYLPRPKLISLNMKPRDMKEIFNDTGILRSEFSAAEKENFLSQAQQHILARLDDIGIIKKAAAYSKLLLETWLKILGFKEITIIFKEAGKKTDNPGNKEK